MEIKRLKNLFEIELKEAMGCFGPKTPLSAACEYALLSGGKRIRPIIVMMINEALGSKVDITEAALSIEYFHTASLIADDLPCMDNADSRRERESLHVAFGESTALLASYALINMAYEKIGRQARQSGEREGLIVLDCATRSAGIFGATGGQFEDLNCDGADFKTLKSVIEKKTITLFEAAFVFGWVFSGGNTDYLPVVEQAAYHFGMAFQLADDLLDYDEDRLQSNPMNAALCLGREPAFERFALEMQSFTEDLKRLQVASLPFQELRDLVISKVAASR